ncbi:MAG: PTS sugar transporter subunit IIA [bacterium]|nr:PTS sugar transporter subunit IIA [bacterium]
MEKLLTLKEVSELLQVNERTIHRLLQSGKIPASKVGNQWRFHPAQIEIWLLNGGENTKGLFPSPALTEERWQEEEAFQLFAPERVRLDVQPETVEEAIQCLVSIMVDTGHLLQGEIYTQAVLERERISSTGIGNGVALPHGWHPINDLFRVPLVACARFARPVDFKAVDGKPVDLAFLFCSPRGRHHLHLLRSLSLLASNASILADLRTAKTASDFLAPLTAGLAVI